MDLKFYLNKIIKVDNVEEYTLGSLIKLRECYENFLEKTEGLDPDFPTLNFGGKGKKIKGKNAIQLGENLVGGSSNESSNVDIFNL